MPTEILMPPNSLYIQANEELMDDIGASICKSLSVDKNGMRLAFNFCHPATEQYLSSHHLSLFLDHTYKAKMGEVEDAISSFGLKKSDFTVSLCSVFLMSAIDDQADKMLSTIRSIASDDFVEGDFGRYGLWNVFTEVATFTTKPMLTFWYKDIGLLGKVIKSDLIPENIEVEVRGKPEVVGVNHMAIK